MGTILSADTIGAIIQLAAKYGPETVTSITALFKKTGATVADVEAAFSNLKPYSAYGIPDVAPTAPVIPLSTVVTSTVPTL